MSDTSQTDANAGDVEIDIDEESITGKQVGDSSDQLVLPDGTVVDITAEQQARIDRLFDVLNDATFYELLEVRTETSDKAIKRAYYRLSREFHPDRFYRRKLGPYKAKLEQVFARVNEAYRVLSDASERADYDARLAGGDDDVSQVSMATHEVAFGTARERRRGARKIRDTGQVRMTKKKAPMPSFLTQAKEQLAGRLRQARKAYLLGKRQWDVGEFDEAAKLLQRSLLLDPKNEEARQLYQNAVGKARNQRAEGFWREGQDALKREDPEAAANKFKAAVECQPTRGKYYMAFGKVIWEHTMRHRTAIELFRTAVEKEPNNLDYLLEIAQAYENVGMPNNALKALERATQIAPDDPAVKKALKRLR
jgi:curved DNA-binding protein CbpA